MDLPRASDFCQFPAFRCLRCLDKTRFHQFQMDGAVPIRCGILLHEPLRQCCCSLCRRPVRDPSDLGHHCIFVNFCPSSDSALSCAGGFLCKPGPVERSHLLPDRLPFSPAQCGFPEFIDDSPEICACLHAGESARTGQLPSFTRSMVHDRSGHTVVTPCCFPFCTPPQRNSRTPCDLAADQFCRRLTAGFSGLSENTALAC